MGSFYTLGVIHEFVAISDQSLSNMEWEEALDERVDLRIFDLHLKENELHAALDPHVFRENILDFYNVLRQIAGPSRSVNIDAYEENFGVHLENYQYSYTNLYLENNHGCKIRINASIAVLFIEGKVRVEEFRTEPHLINWLFRNSKIDNKLAGCIISDVS